MFFQTVQSASPLENHFVQHYLSLKKGKANVNYFIDYIRLKIKMVGRKGKKIKMVPLVLYRKINGQNFAWKFTLVCNSIGYI